MLTTGLKPSVKGFAIEQFEPLRSPGKRSKDGHNEQTKFQGMSLIGFHLITCASFSPVRLAE